MLMNEVCQATNLTKKAIEYYIEQGLISPQILTNGYRKFGESDVALLQKISVLRKLGLSTVDIKSVLADEDGTVLQKIALQKELNLQHERAKRAILDQVATGKSLAEIEGALSSLEQSKTITNMLLEAFPGYYGRFICLHFAPYLNEPIVTSQQQVAYQEILGFLDELPALTLPEELQDFLTETTQNISLETIQEIDEQTVRALKNPEQFFAEHKDMLTRYLEYKKTDEYKNSSAFKLHETLKAFTQASGYYEVFIPALKRLSPCYARYQQQLEAANKMLLTEYPELEKSDD